MSMLLSALLATSLTMSAVILSLWLAGKLLPHKISATCRYYMWVIVLIGLLIPLRPNIPIPFEPIPISPLFEASNSVISSDESEPRVFIHSLPAEKRPAGNSLVLFGIWMVGASGVLFYHLLVYGKFISAVRRWGVTAEDERVLAIMRTVWDDMKLKRSKVMIKTCALVSSPMLIGFHKPAILLPEKPIASDELEYIIRHELIHYKRGDMWINLLRLFVMSMHWFNPFVYIMGKMFHTDCEASCDETVVADSNIDRRRQYGETIISFVGNKSARTPVLSTYFYGGKNDMKKRLLSIMDTSRKSKLWATACVAAAVVMTLLSGNAFAASTDINAVSGDILYRKQETKKIFTPIGYTAGAAIGESAAEDTALDIVGAGSVVLAETKYKKDGRVEYKITVVSGDVVYKIELHGDGTLKKMAQENVTGTDQDAALYASNVIGGEEAARIALEKSGGGTVIKCKLDYKKEGLRYEVKIINNSVEYKIKMYAETGAIYDYSFKSK